MDMFFDIIRIMGRDYPEMFNFLIILALIIVAIIILYIIHWWKKRTGQWITTMNHLIKDETWVGKRVIHAAMSREELDRAIGEFVEMYSTEEKSVQHPTVTQDAEGYTLTLPSTIGYNLFCYWVNHLVYFDEKKRFNKQVTAWYEVPEDAEGAWKPFAGKTLKFFIPESDDDYDDVYFTTKDNRCFRQEMDGPLKLVDAEELKRGVTPAKKKKPLIPIILQLLFWGMAFVFSLLTINRYFVFKESDADATSDTLRMQNVNVSYVPTDTAKLGWVTRLIACGNTKALVSMMDFPIRRKYPLHDIKDADEFKQRFDEIFDKGFRERVARKESAKWYNHGYRGYCYGKSGDLWVYEKLYLIDYYSPQEQSRYLQLVKKEMGSLHESLGGKEWRPYCCFKVDNGGIVRVDYAQRKGYRAENVNIDKQAQAVPQLQPIKLRGDEVFRMSLYSKGSDLHGMPRRIMYGKVVIGGSLSSRDHQFVDEDGNTVTFGDPFYDDELILFTGAHGGNGMFEQRHTDGYKLTPCYWLDLINL